MTKLSKNGRKAIRRGLNNVRVGRISWAELAEKGYAAMAETDARHGYAQPPKSAFQKFLELRRDSPFYEVWGSWEGEELISWLSMMKADDWAAFEFSPSRAAALHNYANNAMRYEALRHLLTIEKRRVVVTGLSTVKPGLDPRTAYVYNTRMGFEAVPVHRVLQPCRWLSPLVANRRPHGSGPRRRG